MPPLSERERKILEEIERGLDTEAPSFVTDKGSPDTRSRSSTRTGALLFVTGLALLFAFFATRLVVVGALSFAAMVAGIVLLASAVSNMVEHRGSGPKVRKQSLRRSVEGFEARLRARNRRR